jgi:hypothetical protein
MPPFAAIINAPNEGTFPHNSDPGTTIKNLPVNSIQFATLKIESHSSHTTQDPQNATATVAFCIYGVRGSPSGRH